MSWFSNALSATSKGINNLKSSLLGSEADGDTEDDTHVCRVLRGYYNEKGRSLPPWLPPDPKTPAPPPVTQVPSYSGSRYGGLNSGQSTGGAPTSTSSGLSSLWDNRATQQQVPQSLRASSGRSRPGGAPPPFENNSDNSNNSARPGLPAQRSYQLSNTSSMSSSGNVSTADKLRQRLGRGAGGARTASPANQSGFAPPPAQGSSVGTYPQGGGSNSGVSNYEDRFAPGGMYDSGNGGRYGGGNGSRPSNEKPFMAANAPWATDESEFMGGGGYGSGGGGGRQGLPSGPRRGLPSGPRMR